MDEPTEEMLRRSLQQDVLPLAQLDLALVFAPGAMLREYVLPVAVRRTHSHAAVMRIAPHSNDDPCDKSLDGRDAFVDDRRIGGVQRDLYVRVAARRIRDASIPEVHPQETRVR